MSAADTAAINGGEALVDVGGAADLGEGVATLKGGGAITKDGGAVLGMGEAMLKEGGAMLREGGAALGMGVAALGEGGAALGEGGAALGEGGAALGEGGAALGEGGAALGEGGAALGEGGASDAPWGLAEGETAHHQHHHHHHYQYHGDNHGGPRGAGGAAWGGQGRFYGVGGEPTDGGGAPWAPSYELGFAEAMNQRMRVPARLHVIAGGAEVDGDPAGLPGALAMRVPDRIVMACELFLPGWPVSKLNRRLQRVETEAAERAQRDLLLYGTTLALALINTWLWMRR
uniref:Mitochondrial fission factor n=1 Tax=Petromyzon marinus TaxID=7757 RepID=A0AAJ7XHJ0_PETMA|nr:glycine-rich cell wall structural protein 1-like [Petromyzon marinus]